MAWGLLLFRTFKTVSWSSIYLNDFRYFLRTPQMRWGRRLGWSKCIAILHGYYANKLLNREKKEKKRKRKGYKNPKIYSNSYSLVLFIGFSCIPSFTPGIKVLP